MGFSRKWKNRTNTITYNSWKSMRNRCLFDGGNSKNHKQKGISICSDWVDNFDKFVSDMGDRPEGTTLDRIDSKKGYFKENCRWADWRVQQNNKEFLTSIEHDGETKTIGEWAYELDLNKTEINTAYKRHSKYGAKTFEEIFHPGSLRAKRVSERENKCNNCGTTKSCKWFKDGADCNTCYHRQLRESKRKQLEG